MTKNNIATNNMFYDLHYWLWLIINEYSNRLTAKILYIYYKYLVISFPYFESLGFCMSSIRFHCKLKLEESLYIFFYRSQSQENLFSTQGKYHNIITQTRYLEPWGSLTFTTHKELCVKIINFTGAHFHQQLELHWQDKT